MSNPLRLLFLSFLLVPPVTAGGATQGGAGSAHSGGPADPVDLSERLVGIPVGMDANALAVAAGATMMDAFGPATIPLCSGGPGEVARLSWPDPLSASSGSSTLMQSGVSFCELNSLARPSETAGCGASGAVSAEQCTAAFYDGTPTEEEYDQQSFLSAIALDQVPDPLPGKQTLVAVIDTGIDPTHPAFANSIAAPGFDFLTNSPGGYDQPNGVDDDRDGVVDEAYGHGTHVTGLILVVDPSAQILPYRVLDADGNGTAYDVARAIYQAGLDGAQIINLSLGLSQTSQAVENALAGVTEDDVVVVTSAGNTGHLGVGALAASPRTIAVAAVDDLGVVAPFASYGPAVDVVAPGISLYSTMPGGQYAWWSGSSMSAAVVSGAVSRLWSSTVASETGESSDALQEGGVSVDALNPGEAGYLGSGLIHMGQALQIILDDN